MIDEFTDGGVILENGEALTYQDIGRILEEIASETQSSNGNSTEIAVTNVGLLYAAAKALLGSSPKKRTVDEEILFDGGKPLNFRKLTEADLCKLFSSEAEWRDFETYCSRYAKNNPDLSDEEVTQRMLEGGNFRLNGTKYGVTNATNWLLS